MPVLIIKLAVLITVPVNNKINVLYSPIKVHHLPLWSDGNQNKSRVFLNAECKLCGVFQSDLLTLSHSV